MKFSAEIITIIVSVVMSIFVGVWSASSVNTETQMKIQGLEKDLKRIEEVTDGKYERILATQTQTLKTLNIFNVKIEKASDSSQRAEEAVMQLNETMGRVHDVIGGLSEVMGRMDERIKNVERGTKK